jgi:hypothetical protein
VKAYQISLTNVGCDCDDPVTEVNILFCCIIVEQSLPKVTCLKRNLRVQCPCGYIFDALTNEKDAISRIRLHFERFHKDFLPFGITNAEALALLKKGIGNGKQKFSSNSFSHLKQNSPMTQ